MIGNDHAENPRFHSRGFFVSSNRPQKGIEVDGIDSDFAA